MVGSIKRHFKHRRPSPRNIEIYREYVTSSIKLAELGRRHGLSAQRISGIISVVETWFLEEIADALTPIKVEQYMRLQQQMEIALAEWERSRSDKETEKVINDVELLRDELGHPVMRNGRPVIAKVNSSRVERTKSRQCGDPRYLEHARKCMEDMRKIFGIDAPSDSGNQTEIRHQNNVVIYLPQRQTLDEDGRVVEGKVIESAGDPDSMHEDDGGNGRKRPEGNGKEK